MFNQILHLNKCEYSDYILNMIIDFNNNNICKIDTSKNENKNIYEIILNKLIDFLISMNIIDLNNNINSQYLILTKNDLNYLIVINETIKIIAYIVQFILKQTYEHKNINLIRIIINKYDSFILILCINFLTTFELEKNEFTTLNFLNIISNIYEVDNTNSNAILSILKTMYININKNEKLKKYNEKYLIENMNQFIILFSKLISYFSSNNIIDKELIIFKFTLEENINNYETNKDYKNIFFLFSFNILKIINANSDLSTIN